MVARWLLNEPTMKTQSAVFGLVAVGVSMLLMLVACETTDTGLSAADSGPGNDSAVPVDSSQASYPTDASDASNAPDAPDASDASDASNALDASDADSGQSSACSSPTAPDAGSTCSNEGAACSWGTNPNCPYTYNCTGGTWLLVGSPQPEESCPAQAPTLGATCPLCAYPTGCTYGDAGSSVTLFCDVKPGPEGAGAWTMRP
jgi:hypothetical protein